MNWQTLTVEQYQRIYQISKRDIPDEDKSTQYLSILLNKTEREVEEMTIPDYSRQCREMAGLFSADIPGKSQRYIRTGRLYRVNYEVSTMRFAQYCEVKSFLQGGVVENLHLIMASIVDPVVNYVIYRKPQKNSSVNHEARANDLLQAKFIDCYHSAVFFYQLLKNSIGSMKGFLLKEMETKMTKKEAEAVMDLLQVTMDGFLAPSK